ncbi:MAG: patatin-like phospholipase family protein [Planctomycetota bacterium]|jgi:hypothetical protein
MASPAKAKRKTTSRKTARKKTRPTTTKKTARKKTRPTTTRKTARKKTRPTTTKKTARKTTRKRAAPRARRWGLALAGDWNRGAFLVGALTHLRRAGVLGEIPVASGAGSGALVAAMVALGRWSELHELFSGLGRHRLVRPRYPWLPGGPAASFLLSTVTHTPSLFLTHGGLRELVREHVDPAALQQAACEVRFVAVDMQTGATRSFSNRDDSPDELLAGLLAAASRPVLMPLVRAGYERHQHAEGTLGGYGPLNALFATLREDDAPTVDGILALSTLAPPAAHGSRDYRDIDDVLSRAAGLVAAASGRGDICAAHLVNALLGLRDHLGPRRFATALDALDAATRAEVERHLGKRYVPVVHLHPEAPPGAGPLELDPAASRAALAAGRAAAQRWLHG